MAEPVRILHVLGNMNLGGAESRTMDLYRHIDRSRVQFDFLVHTEDTCHFDKEINELGGHIYRVPRFRIYNYFSYRKAISRFFKEHHEFRAVQGHMTSTAGIYLPLAKKKGIPVTIAHARSAGVDPGVKGVLTRLMRRGLAGKADYLFMCSEPAGCSVFGRRAVEQGRTIFIPNAIETGDFAYNEEIRKRIRRELSLEDSYVIGHVGRFHYAKNHEYLLQIFAQLCTLKKEKKFVLLLLGEGERMDAMRTLARELGVEKQVIFAGNKRNVSDYYQAMDYFVYPSRFEGLPGTMVEAQASGLRCLMSDTICAEVILTDLVKVMSIEQAPEQWAQCLADTMDYKRVSCDGQIAGAGFDVAKQAKRMMVFYETGQWKYEEGQTD